MIDLKLQALEQRRDALVAFADSDIHKMFQESTKKDLDFLNDRILEDPIESVKDLFTLVENKGKRRLLLDNLSLFEDAVSTLNDAIDQHVLGEQPNETQQEKV